MRRLVSCQPVLLCFWFAFDSANLFFGSFFFFLFRDAYIYTQQFQWILIQILLLIHTHKFIVFDVIWCKNPAIVRVYSFAAIRCGRSRYSVLEKMQLKFACRIILVLVNFNVFIALNPPKQPQKCFALHSPGHRFHIVFRIMHMYNNFSTEHCCVPCWNKNKLSWKRRTALTFSHFVHVKFHCEQLPIYRSM